MSETRIQFHIPANDRPNGDVETVLNAIGAFQRTIPHPFDHEYHTVPVEDNPRDGGVTVTLVRIPRHPQTEPTLLEYGERMVKGVESHLPEDARARLMRHYVGIRPIDAIGRE